MFNRRALRMSGRQHVYRAHSRSQRSYEYNLEFLRLASQSSGSTEYSCAPFIELHLSLFRLLLLVASGMPRKTSEIIVETFPRDATFSRV